MVIAWIQIWEAVSLLLGEDHSAFMVLTIVAGAFMCIAMVVVPVHYMLVQTKIDRQNDIEANGIAGLRAVSQACRVVARNSAQPLLDAPEAARPCTMAAIVPPDIKAGERFSVKTPCGQIFQVTCPADGGPGTPVELSYTPLMAAVGAAAGMEYIQASSTDLIYRGGKGTLTSISSDAQSSLSSDAHGPN